MRMDRLFSPYPKKGMHTSLSVLLSSSSANQSTDRLQYDTTQAGSNHTVVKPPPPENESPRASAETRLWL